MAFPSADMLVGSQAVMVVAGEKSQRETLNRLSVEEYNEGTRVDDPSTSTLPTEAPGPPC